METSSQKLLKYVTQNKNKTFHSSKTTDSNFAKPLKTLKMQRALATSRKGFRNTNSRT